MWIKKKLLPKNEDIKKLIKKKSLTKLHDTLLITISKDQKRQLK